MKFSVRNRTGGVLLLCTITALASLAQTFTTLVNFSGRNGAYPGGTLVQGTDGKLYGTTEWGGTDGDGTVFKVAPDGTLTTLHSFCAPPNCTAGSLPYHGLALGDDGNLYGTTSIGGDPTCNPNSGCGTVFRVTPTGGFTVLHKFTSSEGTIPHSGLVLASDGNFYGTTYYGGTSNSGTVFRITPAGKLTTLYSFCAQTGCSDGANPEGELMQAGDGNLYGTTVEGGLPGFKGARHGTLFKITPSGSLTTLYSYTGLEGAFPRGWLIQDKGGNFYGTTESGGNPFCDAPYGCGTVFQVTPSGTLTIISRLTGVNGAAPFAGVVQASDGNLYGTAAYGGDGDNGAIFKLTPSGKLTALHKFTGADGDHPFAGLVQATSGKFYGAADTGGQGYDGTVFTLDMGLGPFVSLLHDSRKVGKIIGILGQGFTGATEVSFNGTPATYAVVSDTFLTATVPAGATSGFVTVTTPSGPLKSNKKFRVQH